MKDKLISIIVPVYNTNKYLPRCLDSLINQTFQNIEILIFNDCSTDNSEEIITEYALNDGRIESIKNKKNIGPGAIRNMGVQRAKGKYILFVDSDDWIDLKACEVLFDIAEKNQLEILVGRYKLAFSEKYVPEAFNRGENIIVKSGQSLMIEFDFFTAVWDKLWLRDFIIENKIKNENTSLFEDVPFVVEGLLAAKKAAVVNYNFYYYYQCNTVSQLKSTPLNQHLRARIWIMSYLFNMKDKYKGTSIEKPLSTLLAKHIHPALSYLRKYKGNNKELTSSLFEMIKSALKETGTSSLKIRSVPLYKRLIIFISPMVYIQLFYFIDKIKLSLRL